MITRSLSSNRMNEYMCELIGIKGESDILWLNAYKLSRQQNSLSNKKVKFYLIEPIKASKAKWVECFENIFGEFHAF